MEIKNINNISIILVSIFIFITLLITPVEASWVDDLFSGTTNYLEEVNQIITNQEIDDSTLTVDDITGGANTFLESGKDSEDPLDSERIKTVSDFVYNILLIVGIVIAGIIGLVIGIKFMLGSVSEKAETKELLIPYIVGCIVVFGAFAIWKLVVEILNQI